MPGWPRAWCIHVYPLICGSKSADGACIYHHQVPELCLTWHWTIVTRVPHTCGKFDWPATFVGFKIHPCGGCMSLCQATMVLGFGDFWDCTNALRTRVLRRSGAMAILRRAAVFSVATPRSLGCLVLQLWYAIAGVTVRYVSLWSGMCRCDSRYLAPCTIALPNQFAFRALECQPRRKCLPEVADIF